MKKLISISTLAILGWLMFGLGNQAYAAPVQELKIESKQVCCYKGQAPQKQYVLSDDKGQCDKGYTPEGKPPCPCPNGKDECTYLTNPLQNDTVDINVIIGGVLKWVLGIMGSLTLLMFVWGGFLWLTSAGNPERVKKGADTMLWAGIGVFLVLASYIILINVTNYITGKQ